MIIYSRSCEYFASLLKRRPATLCVSTEESLGWGRKVKNNKKNKREKGNKKNNTVFYDCINETQKTNCIKNL